MSSTAAAATAILENITTSTYPSDENISSTDLSPSDLSSLLSSLRAEQHSTRASIQNLSSSTAPEIDTWITSAKELQAAILSSLATAKEIVAEAEEGEQRREEVEDQGKKVQFLEKEVEFNEVLRGTLEQVRYADGVLERVQERAVVGDVEGALRGVEEAESSILGLPLPLGSEASGEGSSSSSGVRRVLEEKLERLKADMRETTTECWNAFLLVDPDAGTFRVRKKGLQADVPDAEVDVISLEQIVAGTKSLDCFDGLVKKLSGDVVKVVLRERMVVDEDGLVARVRVHNDQEAEEDELRVGGKKTDDLRLGNLFRDLGGMVDFLATHLPSSITLPLSTLLVPALATLLEEHWLEPDIPLTLPETVAFTSILQDLEKLVERMESYGWNGTEGLTAWIEDAPSLWLTRRREVVLGEVRDLVFTGLRERKVVERVETRVVKRDDGGDGDDDDVGMVAAAVAANDAMEDEWDSAWDDPEEEPSVPTANADVDGDDDDDTSAWDVEDEGDEKTESGSIQNDDEEDWGAWDDEPTSKPPSPAASRKVQFPSQQVLKPNGATAAQKSTPPRREQEEHLTLRETLTTTSIPSHLLTILQTFISDAEILINDPQYSSSPLAPAAKALYTLPTLALAIYRATASTTYTSRLGGAVGNMLLYNDALWLGEELRSWRRESSSNTASGKLRLDHDVTSLETFAKRAYSLEMESQRTILTDILSGAQGFSNCTSPPFKQECENAVQSVVARMKEVHGYWKDVLATGALLQSLGSLVGTVTKKMIEEVEELGDIGEEESRVLKALCEKVMEVRELFIQTGDTAVSGEMGEGEGRDMTFVYCPTWLKFQYLAEILESSLADIRWMWKEGELKLEFDAEEVVELVEALFAESELRRSAVREIRRG